MERLGPNFGLGRTFQFFALYFSCFTNEENGITIYVRFRGYFKRHLPEREDSAGQQPDRELHQATGHWQEELPALRLPQSGTGRGNDVLLLRDLQDARCKPQEIAR